MKALAANEVKTPNMPVNTAAQEADDQHAVALKYQTELATAGMTAETIETLRSRASALREAEGQWRTTYNASDADTTLWEKQEEPKGKALQRELNSAFRFAYRKNNRAMAKVREIAHGQGDDEMIQDLLEYSILGKANPNELTAINFDLTKLDTAATLSASLAALLAKCTGEQKAQHELKDIRDRGFTIMKETLDDIRDCGKYVFADKPDIKKMFTSDYSRRHTTK